MKLAISTCMGHGLGFWDMVYLKWKYLVLLDHI